MDKPLVRWVEGGGSSRLLVGTDDESSRVVATVWPNGVWSTWDRNGTGGENDSEETVKRAKIEAAASAIAQGFI